MIRFMFKKMLQTMKSRYDYDVQYQQDILTNDLSAFLKFMGFQTMASHSSGLPVAPLFAARIRAIIWDDCGPCTQLVVKMALEAKMDAQLIHQIIERDVDNLPADIGLVVQFVDLVLAHHPGADDLRDKILEQWGEKGLIAISFAISSYRVYPALKYALGYGKSCSKVQVNDQAVIPSRLVSDSMGAGHG